MPITKFNALLKLLRKTITAYGRTNKVKAVEFDERLKQVVEAYNNRDKLVFTSEVVADFVNDLSDKLLNIFQDLQEDRISFEKLGITYEESFKRALNLVIGILIVLSSFRNSSLNKSIDRFSSTILSMPVQVIASRTISSTTRFITSVSGTVPLTCLYIIERIAK